jgi:methylthioribose-1-phosphate isomerase
MSVETIWDQKGVVKLVDQTKLPLVERVVTCRNYKQIIHAIKIMQIRGAPAIGIAGAYGVYLGAKQSKGLAGLRRIADEIANTRPTAVNLGWAVERCYRVAAASSGDKRVAVLLSEAKKITAEERASCLLMGKHGAKLIKRGWRVLTHCNAGSLATVGLGTALAPIKVAHRDGKKISVFVDETRPFLQGARLTAYEMKQARVPYEVITDNMSAHFMSRGEVDCVITGADRIAANGDAANKIGTLALAVLCAYYKVPFYVVAPSSTFDLSLANGKLIPIEERPKEEVESCGGRRLVPKGAKVRNPAFDVSPSRLIAAIVCERGIIRPPYVRNIRKVLGM